MMKTFSPGLSDSIASVLADPSPCPHCESSSHIAGGLCVGCLLEAGLDPADESEPDSLNGLLAEINLPDQNWRLGNYEILEEIGRGGMGVIYRARQRHSRRIVAVKRVLSYHADSRETLARFRREAQAAASLDHPNILPIYEVSESEDGLPFFSMKFATGGTLQAAGPALRPELRQCVALVAKVARAVQYAHSRGILHRDLKPGNILLDGRGEPLVSDFGLAKWLDTTSDLTRTLTIFGTPGYIAPEQASAAAAELKPTADVYSLGAILFDLLAGRPPFLGAHALSVIRQAADLPAPKLRTLSKVADRDLETICSRCLERDPSARYPSAHDLAEDLERWLEGRPILARRTPTPTRAWRWSRRNPALATTLAISAVLSALALAWLVRSQKLEKAAHEQSVSTHSLAILPLLNLDDAGDDLELPTQLTEMLDGALSRIGPSRAVFVSPSKTETKKAFDPKAISMLHGASLLLSGTHRTLEDGRHRIALRLVDPDGALLWRKIVEFNAPFELSRNVLDASAEDIYSLFSPEKRTRAVGSRLDPGLQNEKAKEFILAGRELMARQTVADLDRALGCFERAIQLESSSALARAYFATTAGTRLHYAFEAQLFDKAVAEARRAFEINPDLPETHRALAGLAYHQGDLQRALSEAYQFIELGGPEVPMLALIGDCLKTLGQPHRAIAWFEKLPQWGNRPADDAWMIGDCWADLADDERAEANYRRVSDLHPELPQGWLGLCRLRLLNGDFAGARAILAEHSPNYTNHSYTKQMAAQVAFFARDFPEAEKLYTELVKGNESGGGDFYSAVTYQSALGRLRIARGDQSGREILFAARAKEMKEVTKTSHNPDAFYRLAATEASLGDTDAALTHLATAKNAGWIDYRALAIDPRFDGLRARGGYRQIFEEMKADVALLRQNVSKKKE